MITEGRLEHIEAIANEIEKYEKWEPRWDFQKSILSSCATIALTGGAVLLGENELKFKFLISTVTVGAIISAIACLLSIWSHHTENKQKHDFQAQKLKDIIKKVRESVENQSNQQSNSSQ